MTKIIISFCEGHHDIAFLSRILLVSGFEPYQDMIKDFPNPINILFLQKIACNNIADSKLGYKPIYNIPSVAFTKDNTIVFLHSLGGDGRKKERKEVLEMYKNLIGNSELDEFTSNPKISFRFIYFFDADDKGIESRVTGLNDELNLSQKIEYNKISKIDGYEWGCYVFHNDDGNGDLEDILLDLMIKDNESVFFNCESYLKTNKIPKERRREYICTSKEETYNTQVKFKEKKSIISIAGQLQFSGMNNSVIISNSDYIRKSDLEDNKHCLNIKKLFLGDII